MTMEWLPIDLLWRNAIAVIPVALIVAAVCRFVPCRPSTRHTLWLVVLGLLVVAPFLPQPPLPPLPSGGKPPAVATSLRPLPDQTTPARDAALAPPGRSIQPPSSGPRESGWLRAAPDPAQPPDRGRAGRPAPPPLPPRSSPRNVFDPVPTVARGGTTRPETRSAWLAEPWRSAWPGPAESTERRRETPGHSTVALVPDAPSVGAHPDDHRPEDVAVETRSATTAPTSSVWRRWLVGLAVIRDAVISLPPIPAAIWGGGMMLLLASAAWRINRSLRLLREGVAAPPSVARAVAAAAGELGLARPPAVLMIDRRISPMLWCGRRPCLVLPRRLWEQLDEVGRSAVIYHELAHLRRRDHWVCWVQMIIGWIYWWHPVVWWIRRRLREEADCCCDVWVTSLLPRGRRAYAQALLETRKYTSVIGFNRPAVPSVGLGVSTVRAKRFARRLTMVMTAQTNPRMSARGIALAVGLALSGYMVAPIWACPPAKDKDTAYKAYKSDKRLKIVVPAKPIRPRAPWRSATTTPEDDTTTFERFMRDRDRPDRDDMSLEQRIEELERQIERLERHIERLLDNPRRPGVAPGRSGLPGKSLGVTVIDTMPKMPPTPPTPPMPPMAPMAPMLLMPAMAPMPAVMGGGGPFVSVGGGSGGFLCACLRGDSACGCKVVVRSYEVSSGKLEALVELMLRRDVPIRVRPTSDGIEVHATGPQHCVFEIFCMMIDGEDRVKSFQVPKGKLEALTNLMARQDVPIFIEPGSEKITVHGNDLEQAVFGAFVNLIGSGTQEARSRAADAYAPALVERAKQYEVRAGLAMSEARHMKALLRSLATQIRSFERQAERVMGRAEALADKAEALEYEAEEFEDAAENLEGVQRITMIARANALLAQAEGLQQQARSLEVQGEAIEDQAESLEDEAEEIEDRIEDIEEQAEEESD